MKQGLRSVRRVLVFGVAIVWSFGAQAAERLALVIANSAYAKQTTLPNPPLDAQGVAAALREIGFHVEVLADLGKAQMEVGLRDFSRRAAQAEVAVIYYAGHGLEVAKANYLIPVDAELLHERDVVHEGVPLDNVVSAVAQARGLRLVILDACRNNPFAQSMARIDPTRDLTRGLEPIEPSGGVHVAYAAKGGSLAQDGQTGQYSPFAAALIQTLREPPRGVDRLFGAVRERVLAATGGRQEPHLYGPPFSGDVYLTPPGARVLPQPAPVQPSALFVPATPQTPAPAPIQQSLPAATPALDPAQQALCDAAAWPEDRDRPAGVAGTDWGVLRPERHLAACEAMTRAAPGERRFFAILARLYDKAKRGQEAMAMARRGAELGSAAAMNVAGRLFETGRGGIAKDNTQAFLWYQRGAQTADPALITSLGYAYANGVGVPKNETEAVRLYRQAAGMRHPRAMTALGRMYAYGRGVQKDDAEAVRWYRAGAEANDASAINNLGVMYELGRGGLPQNHAEALRLYRQAADLGEGLAMGNIGLMHENGRGVPQSDAEAVRWYRAGADAEDGRAMRFLGWMYEKGRGVPQSDAEAVRWYRASSEEGNAMAMNNLGVMYENGRGGLTKNNAEALRLYRQAADLGEGLAMNNLGGMYENGWGVPKSDAEALRWYRASAEAGHAWGMNNLGVMHRDGRGTPRDLAQARHWLQKAADSDHAEASAQARKHLANLGR